MEFKKMSQSMSNAEKENIFFEYAKVWLKENGDLLVTEKTIKDIIYYKATFTESASKRYVEFEHTDYKRVINTIMEELLF